MSCPVEEGDNGVALVGTRDQPGSTHHTETHKGCNSYLLCIKQGFVYLYLNFNFSKKDFDFQPWNW